MPILIDVHDIERAIPKIMRPLHNVIKRDISRVMIENAVEAPMEIPMEAPIGKQSSVPDMTFQSHAALTHLGQVG